MIKSVLFDLDGVLVDACEIHYLSLNKALKQVCNYEISRYEHKKFFNGLPTSKKLEMLNDQRLISSKYNEEIWDLKQKFTKQTIKELLKPDPIKIKLLDFLMYKDIFIACVTNSIRETAQLMLEITGQFQYLNLLIANNDVKNRKPHPEGFIRAMIQFQTMPENTLIIEDSLIGFHAAKNTGAKIWKVKECSEVTLEGIKNYL